MMSTQGRAVALAAVGYALLTLATSGEHLAVAETRRVAVIVGHNAGGAGERPLRYAEDDASKIADVLVELGDVDRSRLFLVRGQPRAAVVDAIARATAAVKAARQASEDRVVLLFFYSGHSDASSLALGGSRLPYQELRRLLEATGAEVRLSILDGCKSGGIVAQKGGRPVPAFEIGLRDQLNASGEATLTSSAADEASLESSEIRGSFFTHHLVSGLRGAADLSSDGRVTLTEAYQYAFNRTVVASAATGSAPQHPNYDYQLSGGGELVLTRVGEHSAALQLPPGFARALITNVLRDQVVAELTRDEVRTLAVTPGDYAVRLWKDGEVYSARIKALANATMQVSWSQLLKVQVAPVVGKGVAPEPPPPPLDERWAQEVAPPHGVLGVSRGEPPLSPEAQAIWDEELLIVEDVQVVNLSDGVRWIGSDSRANSTTPSEANKVRLFRGRLRHTISPSEFLQRAGRLDLAKREKDHRSARVALSVSGAIVLGGGFVYLVSQSQDDDATAPLFIMSTGLALGLAAYLVGDGVPQGAELRAVAEDHNRKLRARLRGEPPRPSPARPVAARWQVAPTVTSSGGGLSFFAIF